MTDTVGKIGAPLPRTIAEIHERALDARGRPAGRDPLPRTVAEIHGRTRR